MTFLGDALSFFFFFLGGSASNIHGESERKQWWRGLAPCDKQGRRERRVEREAYAYETIFPPLSPFLSLLQELEEAEAVASSSAFTTGSGYRIQGSQI